MMSGFCFKENSLYRVPYVTHKEYHWRNSLEMISNFITIFFPFFFTYGVYVYTYA